MSGNLYNQNGRFLGRIATVETSAFSGTKVTVDNGGTYTFRPGDVLRDAQGDWRIRRVEESLLDSIHYMQWADRVLADASKKKEVPKMSAATIKNVIFNPPATIIYWSDNIKTVVKCSPNDVFDPEKGMAMAIAKRCAGNNGKYYKEIRRWTEKSKEIKK
mgnify:CR=1 FL=1